MPQISWSESLSVHNAKIDEQHKILVNLFNDLYIALEGQSESDLTVDTALNTLIEYVKVHFETEENIMEKYGYNEISIHKTQHEFFKKKIDELKEKFDNGEAHIKLEIFLYLRGWLIDHIMQVDKKMGKLVNEHES